MRRYLDWLLDCIGPAACAREIWVESPVAHPTAMIRASVMERVGGYREMGWPEDYDLWLRIHRTGGSISNLSETLYEWTDSPERLSRRDSRYAPEAFLRCRVHHLRLWLAERGIDRPLLIWGAGRDGGSRERGMHRRRQDPPPPHRCRRGSRPSLTSIPKDRSRARAAGVRSKKHGRVSNAFYLAAGVPELDPDPRRSHRLVCARGGLPLHSIERGLDSFPAHE
jgi:hypothetical protein